MSKKYIVVCFSLLISLFIYLFYRTQNTVVNQVLIHLISFNTYIEWKTYFAAHVPLPEIVVFSVPEGLWMLCITLTSKPYYIGVGKNRIYCIYIPLVFCVVLEFFQLLHITNGRFDFMDILVFVIFWLRGAYGFTNKAAKQDIFTRPNLSSIVCLVSYCIVYLAHVFK